MNVMNCNLPRQNIASSFVLMAIIELASTAVKTCLGEEAMALISVSLASEPIPAQNYIGSIEMV